MIVLRCAALTAKGRPCQRPASGGRPVCAWHDPARRPEGRVWTRAKRWQLMTCLEQGWDDARIAEELGVSANAVHLARRRYGIKPRNRTVMTSRAVANLLGVGCAKSVVRWLSAGWLRGERSWVVGKHRVWMVREPDLLRFLENPAHWHRWHPERITDQALREWVLEMRGDERFLSHEEARAWLCRERSICVERATIGNWLDKGRLPFVRNGRGNRLIRLSDLAAVALPPFGQGGRKQTWEPCVVCGDPDGAIREACVTPARLRAERYGVAGLVCARCHRRLRTEFERAQRMAVAA